MNCPHCSKLFHPQKDWDNIYSDKDAHYHVMAVTCPACERFVFLINRSLKDNQGKEIIVAYPRAINRSPLSDDVPEKYKTDYLEAVAVLADSPKASATLSRRCLQNLLRDHVGVKKGNLSSEIDQLLLNNELPSYLSEAVDAIRNIGNFAAHPMKSTNSLEIIDVEVGEAEWSLDVLERLFDFYFVQPAILKKHKDNLNKKLAEAGKPDMK